LANEEFFKIIEVRAREVYDTKIRPMLEVELYTKGGGVGVGAAPCGSSVGKHEAITLRDGARQRYDGLGVLKAVEKVKQVIGSKIIGMDVRQQKKIDRLMIDLDGTENKSVLGGNTILSVSLAVADAAANALGIPLYRYIGGVTANILPIPIVNMINGGPLSPTDMAFQEHGVVPTKFKSLSEALRACAEVNYELKRILKKKYGKKGIAFGQSHGYAPPLKDSTDAFDAILAAIKERGYEGSFMLYIDVAASQFYDEKKQRYVFTDREMSREDMFDLYKDLVCKYPIFTIEDPFHEDDFGSHAQLTKEIPKTQIVGDDLFTTNMERLKLGIEMGAANAIILKPNQAGSLTETFDVARFAIKHGYQVIPAYRSSTETSPIAHIAVGLGCRQVKFGPMGFHGCAYNPLLRIEEELGECIKYTKFSEIISKRL
jgi:enolase